MKIRNLLFVALAAASFSASAQQINPVTKAMLDGYSEWLASNPNDYQTLFERADQYNQLKMYDNAYIDIVKAIDNTPAKDGDMLSREFSLLSDILVAQGNFPRALEAIEKSLQVNPDAYANIYKKGEILLNLDRLQEAYTTFQSLQRLRSRSQEAFFGMAKARARQGNMDDARDLIKEVEQSDPSNYLTYLRIGDFYDSIGVNDEAANNYLIAFAMADNSAQPMTALIELGKKDYPATLNAINFGISKTRNVVPLNFLKANIAYLSGNFNDAYDAYSALLASPEGNDPDLYAGMARTALALNRIADAQSAINSAIRLDPNPRYYVSKAAIERAAGLPSEALASASKALDDPKTNAEALIETALADIELKNYDSAVAALNELAINNADDPLPLMLRAYISKYCKNDEKKAVADYSRVAATPYESFPEITYCALAKTFSGKRIDGDAMIEKAATTHAGKNDAYWIAVYYAQTGNLEKAIEWRDKAVAMGYANKYNLEANTTANLNIAPLRKLK